MNNFAIAFKWAVILGILVDWFYAIPAILIPNAVVGQLGGEPARMSVWPAFAALLMVLVQLFFFSGACDIHRYRTNAYFAVLFRLVMALFFLCLHPCIYPAIGWYNAVLLLLQLWLLTNALRFGPPVRP